MIITFITTLYFSQHLLNIRREKKWDDEKKRFYAVILYINDAAEKKNKYKYSQCTEVT